MPAGIFRVKEQSRRQAYYVNFLFQRFHPRLVVITPDNVK